jgi:excisionase family DNA binding protein
MPRKSPPTPAPAAAPRRYATLEEAADYLGGCNPRTVRREIARGRLTGYKLGRLVRVDLNEVDALLEPITTTKGRGRAAS